MDKKAIYSLFRKMRLMHTVIIGMMVFIMLVIISYVYNKGPLVSMAADRLYWYILASAIVSLLAVLYVVILFGRRTHRIPEEATLKDKLILFQRIYATQAAIMVLFIQLNTIAFLLSESPLFFVIAFALLIFLLTIKPSKERFIKQARLDDQEEDLF